MTAFIVVYRSHPISSLESSDFKRLAIDQYIIQIFPVNNSELTC